MTLTCQWQSAYFYEQQIVSSGVKNATTLYADAMHCGAYRIESLLRNFSVPLRDTGGININREEKKHENSTYKSIR